MPPGKCRTVKGHACIVITMNAENTQSMRDSKYMFARKLMVDVKPLRTYNRLILEEKIFKPRLST